MEKSSFFQDGKTAWPSVESIAESLRTIDSMLSPEDEDLVQLPLKHLVPLIPSRYVVEGAGDVQDCSVPVHIDNLFFRLSRGKVTIETGQLAEKFPDGVLVAEAVTDTTEINIPLNIIVEAIPPARFRERMATAGRPRDVSAMPDHFPEIRQALQGLRGGGAAAAVPPPVASPAIPPPVVEALAGVLSPAAGEAPAELPAVPTETAAVAAPVVAAAPVVEPVASVVEPAAPVVVAAPVEALPEQPAVQPVEVVVAPVIPAPVAAAVPESPAMPPVPATAAAAPVAAPVKRTPPRRVAAPVDDSLEGDYLEPESLGGVNLNAASVAQLMTLDGVSAGLAEAIVSYRQAHGPFVSIFDIASVPRLGRGTFRRISGMPYSDTRKHRRHKLAQLLGMSARDVGDLRLVASGICRMSGVAGCLLSDPDGMLMAESGATSYAAPMSAVIPRMFRLIYENMAVASVGEVNSLSLCVKERLYTIVAGARFCLTVVHQTSRLTHTQITTIQKLAAELDWLLSHRGYIGRSGV